MKHRAIVDVILFGKVRGGCIDHRRKNWRGAPARDQHFGLAHSRPHGGCEALDRFHGPRSFAGKSGPKPIEK